MKTAFEAQKVGFAEKYSLDGVEYTVAMHAATPCGWHWRLLYAKASEMPGFPHISRD